MADDTDGVGEALDDSLRTALTVAAQIGERAARLREQSARQREARTDQHARELHARYEAERSAARAALASVLDPGWWATADTRDIAEMWATATAWRDHDTAAAHAAETIRREVLDRHGTVAPARGGTAGTDAAETRTDDTSGTPGLVAAADGAERRDRDSIYEGILGDFDDYDPTPVPGTVDDSGHDPFAEPAEEPEGYDSPERRTRFASDLERRGISTETVAARILADEDNATHPAAAVGAGSRRGRGLRLPSATAGRERDVRGR
jgi:colicin import membrane protein